MANKSRFVKAEQSIRAYFTKGPKKIYTRDEVKQIFYDRRGAWNLPIAATADKFLTQLINSKVLTTEQVQFEGYMGQKLRYVTEDFSLFKLATSLHNKSYLSHYSAVYLNGLTTQIPKTLYITFEQSRKINIDREMEQEAIDTAFSKPQRKTNSRAMREGFTLVMHNGMYTNRQGVTMIDEVPVTNLERTLIDIMVRPNYAGGVNSVLDAYKKARPQVSLNKLLATLDNLNYIYPYHQALGFYLERAGYEGKWIDDIKNREMFYNFYLTYEMQEKEFSEKWKLWYPKGM